MSDLAVAQYRMENHSIKSSLWTAPACLTATAILVKDDEEERVLDTPERPIHPRTA
jgi:hypothetical protein